MLLAKGATYIRQGGHHVGHWPTFLVVCKAAANKMLSAHSSDGYLKSVSIFQYFLKWVRYKRQCKL